MELDGNHSDHTEGDMFSDEEGSRKSYISSPEAPKNEISFNNYLKTPVPRIHEKIEFTEAVIPKTPLSLQPFISKGNDWTSDLETPETNWKHKKTLPAVTENLDDSQSVTPVNNQVPCGLEEIVPNSPMVSSKKAKKLTKRRIFDRDSLDNSNLDVTIVPEQDIRTESSLKRSKSIGGTFIEKNDSASNNVIIEKVRQFRELSSKTFHHGVSHDNNHTASNNIQEDDFVKSWRALESADKAYCNNDKSSNIKKVVQKPLGLVPFSKIFPNDNENNSSINDDNRLAAIPSNTQHSPSNPIEVVVVNELKLPINDFCGFSKEDQRESKFLLLKFKKICKLDRHKKIKESNRIENSGFIGFPPSEKKISIDYLERHKCMFENILKQESDKTSSIQQSNSSSNEETMESRFVPKLIMTVNTEFVTGSKKAISIDIDKIAEAKKVLLEEHCIDLLLDEKNSKSNIVNSHQCSVASRTSVAVDERKGYVNKLQESSIPVDINNKFVKTLFRDSISPTSEAGSSEGKSISVNENMMDQWMGSFPSIEFGLLESESIPNLNQQHTDIIQGSTKISDTELINSIVYKSSAATLPLSDAGFITVSHSDDALTKAKKKFNEGSNDNKISLGHREQPGTSTDFKPHMKEKAVNINRISDEKAKKLFNEDIGEDTSINKVKEDMAHFSSSKKLSIPTASRILINGEKVSNNLTDIAESNGFGTDALVLTKVSEWMSSTAMPSTSGQIKEKIIVSKDAFSMQRYGGNDEEIPAAKITSKSSFKPPMNKEVGGFMTGKGKAVMVSEKALSNAKAVFNEDFNKETLVDNTSNLKEKYPSTRCDGFMTGKGKTVNISKDALARAKEEFNKDIHEQQKLGTEVAHKNKKNTHKSNLENSSYKNVGGFMTGKGKAVMVSEKALSKAKTVFNEDFNEESLVENTILKKNYPSTHCDGFMTGKGKTVNISDGALAKAKEKLNKDFHEQQELQTEVTHKPISNNSPVKNVGGFITGKGKAVMVSEKALLKAKTVYNEEFNKEILPDNTTILKKNDPSSRCDGFMTGEGKTVNISKDALAKAKEQFNKDFHEQELRTEATHISSFNNFSDKNVGGFMTGKGKAVLVSEKALSNAKTVFNEDFNKEIPFENTTTSKENYPSTHCDGFMTGEGKTVNISKDALAKAKEQFNKDFVEQQNSRTEVAHKSSFANSSDKNVGGFMTGKGKAVMVSEKALSKAKTVFIEDFNEETLVENTTILKENCSSIHCGGFTTGKGKSVDVSKKALSRARTALIENFNEENLSPTTTTPKQQTRSCVNSSALKKVKGQSVDDIAENVLSKGIFNGDLNEDMNESYLLEIGNLKKKLGSRSNVLSLPQKHKTTDDITPFGRKRCRLGSSMDLQARKLFNEEADREDQELIDSAKYFENKTTIGVVEKIANSTASYKNKDDSSSKLICDEVQASIIALEEDIRIMDNSNVEPSIKISDKYFSCIRDDKRPTSLPNSIPASIGEIKKKEKQQKLSLSPNYYHESIPDDLIFDSQNSDDYEPIDLNQIDKLRLSNAIQNQEKIIQSKKIHREKPQMGSLLKVKIDKNLKRTSLRNLSNKSFSLPPPRSEVEYSEDQIDPQVSLINSTKATSYQFNLTKFYPKNKQQLDIGIVLDDGAHLIPNEKHLAGVQEFKKSFLASPGVDPSLLPVGWLENHYKWIIWKLAAMDKLNFQKLSRVLSPQSLMSQLKYRYDREIDRSERPAIRKILEKDDVPSKRMVLCVSRVIPINKVSPDGNKLNASELELTDGWYAIMATTDNPLSSYINSGKIKEGTKLVICGAQLINLEEGCYPLEVSNNVRLKISANSTRRAKWFTKLGYQSIISPIASSLKSIHPSGGPIGKLVVAVARVYPLLYREKTKDGKTVLRNSRCEEKIAVAYERECQSKAEAMSSTYNNSKNSLNYEKFQYTPRDVFPCLKIRIADGSATGIVTIWSNAEECSQIFKETSCIAILNGIASGKRLNELQITANKWTAFHEYKRHEKMLNKKIVCKSRIFTPLFETTTPRFSPTYGEFDTIGIVVSTGPAPHGLKNFETMNLAYRNDKKEDSYLSVLFWQGISAHGYTEIATVGSLVSCLNLEWRRNTYKSLPTAFCSERTIITKNPRQISHRHLCDEVDKLKDRIDNMQHYLENSVEKIQAEILKKNAVTTPTYRYSLNSSKGSETYIDSPGDENFKNTSANARIERLQYYGPAPSLSPICINSTSLRGSLPFKSPLTTSNIIQPEASDSCHKKL